MTALTLNQTLSLLEVFATEAYVLSISETDPPVSPAIGDAYIPIATATGDWAGNEENIVVWLGAGWFAMTPTDGMKAWIVDEAAQYQWDDSGGSWSEVVGGGGSGSGSVGEDVTQASHGLAVGNAAYFNGTNWLKAKADAQATLGTHLVSAVADTDNFSVVQAGIVTGLSGLVAGTYYFVSAATAGALTDTEPATYSNPILFATSTTTGYVLPWRASTVSAGAADIISRWTAASASGAASLQFHEDTDNGTNKVTLQGPASIGSDITVTLPSAAGVLINEGYLDTAALPLDSGQIAFPATQNASADANTLDDYEEGAWTPTLQDASLSDAESQAYTTQLGYYQKIGNVVNIYGNITTSSIGTLTGANSARIGGLPFTSSSTDGKRGGGAVAAASNLNLAAGVGMALIVSANATDMQIWTFDSTTGGSALTITEWSADGSIRFIGMYEAAA